MRASDVMTRSVVTVTQDALRARAVRLSPVKPRFSRLDQGAVAKIAGSSLPA